MSAMNQYPDFWLQSSETVTIIEAYDAEAQKLRGAVRDLLEQCNVATATHGLALWERQLGLETDISKPLDYRRSRVTAKLRGTGTVTVAMIQTLAESFSNGAVDVLEDAANYHFDIKFVGTIGIPPNMDDLTAAIDEIKPAHLSYGYLYVYNTYGDLQRFTWGQLQGKTYLELREGILDAENAKSRAK